MNPTDGNILQKTLLEARLFGEGITLYPLGNGNGNGNGGTADAMLLLMFTWQSKEGIAYVCHGCMFTKLNMWSGVDNGFTPFFRDIAPQGGVYCFPLAKLCLPDVMLNLGRAFIQIFQSIVFQPAPPFNITLPRYDLVPTPNPATGQPAFTLHERNRFTYRTSNGEGWGMVTIPADRSLELLRHLQTQVEVEPHARPGIRMDVTTPRPIVVVTDGSAYVHYWDVTTTTAGTIGVTELYRQQV